MAHPLDLPAGHGAPAAEAAPASRGGTGWVAALDRYGSPAARMLVGGHRADVGAIPTTSPEPAAV